METTEAPTRHTPGYLAYVDSVVRCAPDHLAACVQATGARPTAGLADYLRWPGYVGSRYDAMRWKILCAAQVHHASELARTAQRVQEVLREIFESGAAPAAVDRLAAAYEKVIERWGPWTKFKKILRGIDPTLADPSSIAYVNVAKCWQDPQIDKYFKPMRVCEPYVALSDLRNVVKADVVLVLSSDNTLVDAGIPNTPGMFNFPGRPSDAHLARIARAAQEFLDNVR